MEGTNNVNSNFEGQRHLGEKDRYTFSVVSKVKYDLWGKKINISCNTFESGPWILMFKNSCKKCCNWDCTLLWEICVQWLGFDCTMFRFWIMVHFLKFIFVMLSKVRRMWKSRAHFKLKCERRLLILKTIIPTTLPIDKQCDVMLWWYGNARMH